MQRKFTPHILKSAVAIVQRAILKENVNEVADSFEKSISGTAITYYLPLPPPFLMGTKIHLKSIKYHN